MPVATVYESPIATYLIGLALTNGVVKARCVRKTDKISRLSMMGPPCGGFIGIIVFKEKSI
jgi:hypothetical protein